MYRVLASLKGFKPKSLIDIGANQGSFAISIKKYIPSVKSFFLIEANKNCAKVLKNLSFEFEICLLSSIEEEKKFYINPKNIMCTGNSYYIENTRHFDESKFEKIRSTTLDQLMNRKKKDFDLIKLDTQGSELDILKGGFEVLKKADYIIIECNTDKKSYNKDAPKEGEIFNFLISKGFKHKLLIEEHLWLDEKDFSFRYGDVFQKDFLFSRKKIKKSFYFRVNYILNVMKKSCIKLKFNIKKFLKIRIL